MVPISDSTNVSTEQIIRYSTNIVGITKLIKLVLSILIQQYQMKHCIRCQLIQNEQQLILTDLVKTMQSRGHSQDTHARLPVPA